MAESSESEPEEIPVDQTLLLCARRGQTNIIRDILNSKKDGKIEIDINCKGTQKSNRGWTPLHLAAYFGHKDVVQLLLENGASVNEMNTAGDTPLHKAAHTGRVEVVMVLIKFGSDVSLVNAEGHTPKSVTNDPEILKLIKAVEQQEVVRLEEELMSSVRLGDVNRIEELVQDGRLNKVNCQDSYGNSPLHVAAVTGKTEVAVYLLQKGVDTSLKNKQGLLASDVAKTEQMKQLLNVKPKKDVTKVPSRFEGLLMKRKFVRSNPVWVVLERGVLSYFRNRGDASTGSKRRGMKYLDEAKLKIYEENDYDFMVQFSDGTVHRLAIHAPASEVRLGRNLATGEIVTRQMWINSFKEHIAYNTHYLHKGERAESKTEAPVASLKEAFQVAQAHQNVLESQVKQLTAYLQIPAEERNKGNQNKLEVELQKTVTLSNNMCAALNQCLDQFSQQEETREKQLHEERECNRVLQESLHALAIEHHELERSYSKNMLARSYSVEDEDFYDCDHDEDLDLHESGFDIPIPVHKRSTFSLVSEAMSFRSCQYDMEGEHDLSGDDIPGESAPTEGDVGIKGNYSNSANTITKNHNPADDPPGDLQINLGGRQGRDNMEV